MFIVLISSYTIFINVHISTSYRPTDAPTVNPTWAPSMEPTREPTSTPTGQPTGSPSGQPSRVPTGQPTMQPTTQPTSQPTRQPTGQPTAQPTGQPTTQPSASPTGQPTMQPTTQPTGQPTRQPTMQPTRQPTGKPTGQPTMQPSGQPTAQPTMQPTTQPTGQPTAQPTMQPTTQPSRQPTTQPSGQPTARPSSQPSTQPTGQPSTQPSDSPTSQPTSSPTRLPSSQPTGQPTTQPSRNPTSQPSSQPTMPTGQPSGQPTTAPSPKPSWAPNFPGFGTPVAPGTVFNSTGQRYEALDASTFAIYAANWRKTHANWIDIDPSSTALACKHEEPHSYPVCVGGFILNGNGGLNNITCSKVQCLSHDKLLYPDANSECLATLPDTLEYVPPPPTLTRADNGRVCPIPVEDEESLLFEPYLGLDQGLPPYFNPLRVIRLNITGTIRGQGAAGECGALIKGAKVDIWQIDATKLNKFTSETMKEEHLGKSFQTKYKDNFRNKTLYDDFGNIAPQTSPSMLRDISCRGFVETDEVGNYGFETTMPPSHGPPRYIMIQVTAPGYETLTTRIYFSSDVRLQQMTTLGGIEESQEIDGAYQNFGFVVDSISGKDTFIHGVNDLLGWRNSTHKDPTNSALKMPGAIAEDPRVIDLLFKRKAMNIYEMKHQMILGHFETKFDIVMKSLRPNLDTVTGSNIPAMDINGLWADENGGLVVIETDGNKFHATQYPHMRSWGSVVGMLSGDTIRGVNFLTPSSSSAALQRKSATTTNKDTNAETMPIHYYTSFESSGVILQASATSDSPKLANIVTELSILWSSTEYGQMYWRKQYDRESHGYRYLKLVITRETSPSYVPEKPDGTLVINEIIFYQNILGQHEAPAADMKMKSPRQTIFSDNPNYQKVTCSSFTDQMHHCFRAFDGDSTSSSSWQTMPVGSSNINHPHEKFSPLNDRSPGLQLGTPQWVLFDFGIDYYIQPSAMRIVCGVTDDDMTTSTSPRGCPRTFQLIGSKDLVHWNIVTKVDMANYVGDEYAHGGHLFPFFWESPTGRPDYYKCGTCDMGPAFRCNLDSYDGTCSSRYCNSQGYCDQLPLCPAGEYMHTEVSFIGQTSMECRQCAPGRYGAVAGLIDSFCTGTCHAGYYCNAGSTTPTQHSCGGEHVYCPRASGQPILAASGRHTVYEIIPTNSKLDSDALAPVHIDEALNQAIKMGTMNYLVSQAPAYVYNISVATGKNIITTNGIGADPVNAEEIRQYGFIDIRGNALQPTLRTYEMLCQRGHYCHEGVQHPCPIGVYGDREGLQESRCTEPCIAGEYCPPGSVTPTICEPGYYCPDGLERVKCPAGTFGRIRGLKDKRCSGLCKQGYYCPDGSTSSMEVLCPAGRYGQFGGHGGSHCSGLCKKGYYCPAGSINDSAVDCGNVGVYCPLGSPEPILVERGYYSIDGLVNLRSNQTICEKGFYCMFGIKIPCPAGTYGNELGMVNADFLDNSKNDSYYGNYCSGLCDAGHYCPKNSSISTQIACPPGRYGTLLGQTDELCEGTCPLGHYCVLGTINPQKCPPGIFGNTTGLGSSSCSTECWESGCKLNTCQEGYYCPEGSTSPMQINCGGPEVYCPTGSALPTAVSEGWYTIGPYPFENVMTRVDQAICPLGHYCIGGVKIKCPPGTYGNIKGLSNAECSGLCGYGFYCPIASYNATSFRCPAGRYGGTVGLSTSACSGSCKQGYHCPEASVSPTEYECGIRTSENRTDSDIFKSSTADTGFVGAFAVQDFEDIDISGAIIAPNQNMFIQRLKQPNMVYCPEGTGNPIVVLPGYYSVGNSRTTRFAQQPCQPGTYCTHGVLYDCPAGRYGITSRLTDDSCSGPCAVGHYCPIGSTSRNEFPCPIGRFGATEGLGDSMCSGPCKRALDCPLGSTLQYPATNKLDSNIY